MPEITVPDIGDFKDVEVIDVLVKPGDKIDVDTPLITLETEKATMDVPSTSAGVVKSVALKKGDRVSKGSVIVELEAGEARRSEQAGRDRGAQCERAAGDTGACTGTCTHGCGKASCRRPSKIRCPTLRSRRSSAPSPVTAVEAHRRSWIRARARKSFGAQICARNRRRSGARQGHGRQRTYYA